MSKFRTDFEMQIGVEFKDPEKAKAYFIDGDWKESFYTFDNLREVAANIALGFHYEKGQWNTEIKAFTKFIDGYGVFIRQDDGETYAVSDEFSEYCGGISIKYEMELEDAGTFLVK